MTAPKDEPTENAIAKGAVGQMGLPNRVVIDGERTSVKEHNARQNIGHAQLNRCPEAHTAAHKAPKTDGDIGHRHLSRRPSNKGIGSWSPRLTPRRIEWREHINGREEMS